MINNAGINVETDQRYPIHRFGDEQWKNILDVDLNGVFNCSKAMIPKIIEAGGEYYIRSRFGPFQAAVCVRSG